MHLIVGSVFFTAGVIFINSAPFEELEPGSQEMRGSSEESAVQQNSHKIPLVISRHFIEARSRGFCFRRLSPSLAPGTPNGFKGWIKKHSSGYLAADEKLYLFFRCRPRNALNQLKRVRRKRSSHNQTPPPPRPCVNDTVPIESDDDETEREGEPCDP